MSAEILRRAANAARDEWEGETAGIFKNAAQIHVAVADLLDATAADLDENSTLDSPEAGDYMPANPEALWCDYCGGAIESPDYATDDLRCHCERWSRALTLARAYLGEQS